jgi:recombination protein RecT
MACDQNTSLLNADRESLMQACRKAAADGLLIDGREAILLPYAGKIQYIPMFQGLLKKVRNSGELKSLTVEIVRENDEFSFWIDENGPHLKHVPARKERGEPELAYAVAVLNDGGTQIEVMNEEQINQVKNVSKGLNSETSPWKKWPDEMWRKSVLRRISKYLPSSTELDRVYQNDNESYSNVTEIDITPKPSKSTLDAIADEFEAEEKEPEICGVEPEVCNQETGELTEEQQRKMEEAYKQHIKGAKS